MTAAEFSPSALTLAALSAPLSVNGSVIRIWRCTPTPTPNPSPLWGGVRGGGAAPCKIALYTEEDAGRRGRLSYPIPRSITSIQFFQAIFSIRSLP